MATASRKPKGYVTLAGQAPASGKHQRLSAIPGDEAQAAPPPQLGPAPWLTDTTLKSIATE